MAKISTYVIDGTIVDGDKVIGSDANNDLQTKNYKIGDLVNYFAASIGNNLLVPYVGATDDVDLGTYGLFVGSIDISGTFTSNGSVGLPGEVLMSQGPGLPAVWAYNIGSQDLQNVLLVGNTADRNINLVGASNSIILDVQHLLGRTSIYLHDSLITNSSSWKVDSLHLDSSTGYAVDYLTDKIRFTNAGNFVDIKAASYSNQSFSFPTNGGFIPMSVNGVYADGSGSIIIPIGLGTVTAVTASLPLSSSGGVTPNLSISQASALGDGYLSSANWNAFNAKQDQITLTTIGTSGAATFIGNVLNVPDYSGAIGTTPNLQQVTDIGNTTTNNIIIGYTTNNTNIDITGVSITNQPSSIGDAGFLLAAYNREYIYYKYTDNYGSGIFGETYIRPLIDGTYNHTNNIYFPDASGTLPLSVNGNFADATGNITISAGGTSTGINGLNGTTNIGLGGTLANDTTIDADNYNFYFNNINDYYLSRGDFGLKILQSNAVTIGEILNNNQCNFVVDPSNNTIYSGYQGFINGLKLDFANNLYQFGDIPNGQGLEIYVNTRNYTLGDYLDTYNGTRIIVNDIQEKIFTQHGGQTKGLYLDFASNQYYIGDTNYFVKVDTSIPNTTISTLSGTGTEMVVADASGVLSRQAIPSGAQNLQQVTDIGNTTTNDIFVGNNIRVGLGPYISSPTLLNTVLGFNALASNDNGDLNVAIGWSALTSNTTGSSNVAVGRVAMAANVDGFGNAAFGDGALASNVSGAANMAFGPYALVNNIDGYSNVAVGSQALGFNANGNSNVGIGRQSGYNSLGSNNVFIGYNAGYSIVNGSDNTIIGFQADSGFDSSGYLTIGANGVTRIQFDNTGQGAFPGYGVGSHTAGTITYLLGVDGSGNIIETTIPTGGGGIPHATASGTDTYTATISGVTSYTDGDAYIIQFTNGNTTGATLNINGLGAVTLYRNNDGVLIGGDITSGGEMICVYDNTLPGFRVIGTSPNTLISYVTNADSVTITKGQVVYAFGGTGDRLTVKLANNTSEATSAQTVGIVMSTSIATNQKGFIITQGLLDGLSILPTSTFADGDPLYLGATAGAITNVKPYAPNHLVYLGNVTTASNGSAGRWYVRVQNGYELQELHNVQAQTPTFKDTLWYDNTVSPAQWKTASISTILGYTPIQRSVNVVSTATSAGSTAATDYVYLVSGTTTVTLPTAVGNTNRYTIKNTGTNVVSIATTSSQTVDGSASPITINVQYVSLDIISDGANWNII